MFFIPLTQIESVELVIHSLKAAGGEADCSSCPASKVCMQQCLSIAKSVERMLAEGSLPQLGTEEPETEERGEVKETSVELVQPSTEPPEPPEDPPGKGHLKVIK